MAIEERLPVDESACVRRGCGHAIGMHDAHGRCRGLHADLDGTWRCGCREFEPSTQASPSSRAAVIETEERGS